MSHANCSFLMSLDADALLGDEDERREFIADEFSDRFRNRLDENNYFHHLAVFFKDGSYLMWPNSEPGGFADVPNEIDGMLSTDMRFSALQSISNSLAP